MTTLEQILKKGEERGMKIGIERAYKKAYEKGFKIGMARGMRKGKAIISLIYSLKLIEKVPNWTAKEIADFTEVKTISVELLLAALKTRNNEMIQKVIDIHFLPQIKLTPAKQVKVSKLITIILKKNNFPK